MCSMNPVGRKQQEGDSAVVSKASPVWNFLKHWWDNRMLEGGESAREQAVEYEGDSKDSRVGTRGLLSGEGIGSIGQVIEGKKFSN
ncbi:hypothetical protein FKM82_027721 [Ascaphus truei]